MFQVMLHFCVLWAVAGVVMLAPVSVMLRVGAGQGRRQREVPVRYRDYRER